MDKEKEILQWASRQVRLVVDKFSSKRNLPVFFNDYDSMAIGVPYNIPESSNIAKGGMMKFTKQGSKFKEMEYRFFEGSVLEIHHHPDYIESFEILFGSMIDELTGKEKVKGDSFDILPYVPHQWKCTEDAHMLIKCKKVINYPVYQ